MLFKKSRKENYFSEISLLIDFYLSVATAVGNILIAVAKAKSNTTELVQNALSGPKTTEEEYDELRAFVAKQKDKQKIKRFVVCSI